MVYVALTIIGVVLGSIYTKIAINVLAMTKDIEEISKDTLKRSLKILKLDVGDNLCNVCGAKVSKRPKILKYLIKESDCNNCGAYVKTVEILGEIITPVTMIFLYVIFEGNLVEIIPHFIMMSALIISVISDFIDKIVLDEVVLLGLFITLLSRIMLKNKPINYLIDSILIFSVMILVLWLSRGGMGGGDVKLYSVVGMGIGVSNSLVSLCYASLVSLITMLPLLITKKVNFKTEIPFVPFIWLGVLITYIHPIEKILGV